MRMRAGHFLHPMRTVRRVSALVNERVEKRRFAESGRRLFEGDARYDLGAVTEGFADRLENDAGDEAILKRICAAYQRAYADEQHSAAIHRPTVWWEQQRHGSLQPVMHALEQGDIKGLGRMYRNFYRDACSAGLIVVQSLAKEYFGGKMTEMNRRYVLADALCRVDYWKKMTGGAFAVRDLSGPMVGNPFGVMVEGTLVQMGAEYQHYCAMRVAEMLTDEDGAVAEIGGGYGGMAYYLLRGRPELRYVGFDVAESVTLTAYFLMRAFPEKRFLLYGEGKPGELANWDVALLPVFTLPEMPLTVEVTFSSHAMTDLSEAALKEYVAQAAAMTRGRLLCIGEGAGVDRLDAALMRNGSWQFEEKKALAWNLHTKTRACEAELTYRRRG